MRLSKGIPKYIKQEGERKKSRELYRVSQFKVEILPKPSSSNHIRILKALSMLLNKGDILDYFNHQKSLQEKAKNSLKKKSYNFYYPEPVSAPSAIDKYPPKTLRLSNEETE